MAPGEIDMGLQEEIDQLTYPPTHTYKLKPLEPTGLLKIRFDHLRRIAPTFYNGKSLLDIGASKGFYSLWAAQHGFKRIVAIEPQEVYADILRRVLPEQATVCQEKFGKFCKSNRPLLPTFDRILITNAPHYLFGEYGGWDWWKDVADLCHDGAQVVYEGPVDMRDKKCFVPKLAPETESQFNTGSALDAPMAAGFELCAAVDSPRPTSDRCILVFVRRGSRHSVSTIQQVQKATLHVSRIWKNKPGFSIYQTTSGLFCKENKNLNLDSANELLRLKVAARSSFATPIELFIYDGEKLVGWAEPDTTETTHWYTSGREPLARDEVKSVLKSFCRYQIGLAGDGYLDLDNGSANWGVDLIGRQYTCDKGAVLPICAARRAFQVPNNYSMKDPIAFRDGSFFRLAHREYSEWLTKEHELAISEAVQKQDVGAIQMAFLRLYQSIE